MDSSWLRNFRAMCKLDAVQFGDIWTLYDQDGEYNISSNKKAMHNHVLHGRCNMASVNIKCVAITLDDFVNDISS